MQTPRYNKLTYKCIPDQNTNFDGPLAGILACSNHITSPLALIIPNDAPNVPKNLKSLLLPHLNGADVVPTSVVSANLYSSSQTATLRSIDPYLSAGGRSVKGWLENLSIAQVNFISQEPLKNINTPEQLKKSLSAKFTTPSR